MTDTLQQDNPTLNLNEDVLEEYQQYFDRLQVDDTFGWGEQLGIRGALKKKGIGTSDEREEWFSGDMQNLFNSVLASGGKEDLKKHLDFAEILFADIHQVTGTNVIDKINLLEFAKLAIKDFADIFGTDHSSARSSMQSKYSESTKIG